MLTGPCKSVALHSSPQIPRNYTKHFQFVLIDTEKAGGVGGRRVGRRQRTTTTNKQHTPKNPQHTQLCMILQQLLKTCHEKNAIPCVYQVLIHIWFQNDQLCHWHLCFLVWIKSHCLSSQVPKEALCHPSLEFNSHSPSKMSHYQQKPKSFKILPPISSACFPSGTLWNINWR